MHTPYDGEPPAHLVRDTVELLETAEEIVAPALEALRQHGFNGVLCFVYHDPLTGESYDHHLSFGDPYAARGAAQVYLFDIPGRSDT